MEPRYSYDQASIVGDMIAVGSFWAHAEGNVARIEALGDGWVEPNGCGRWLLADFEREWVEAVPAPPPLPGMILDDPTLDDTAHAHPAWKRGYQAALGMLLNKTYSIYSGGGYSPHEHHAVNEICTMMSMLQASAKAHSEHNQSLILERNWLRKRGSR